MVYVRTFLESLEYPGPASALTSVCARKAEVGCRVSDPAAMRCDLSQSIHTLEESRFSNDCLLNLPMFFFQRCSVIVYATIDFFYYLLDYIS